MTNKIASLSAILIAVTTSCGGAAKKSKPYNFAWIPKQSQNVFDPGRDGAALRAQELSRSGDTVSVTVLIPGNLSDAGLADQQIAALQMAMDQHVNGIALSVNSPGAATDSAINRAVDGGIPVLTFDSDSTSSQRFTLYGIDNYAAGKSAAVLLSRLVRNTGRIAILTNTDTSPNLTARVTGFTDEMAANHSSVKISKVICPFPPVDSVCIQKIQDVVTQNPDLTGWYFSGVWIRIIARGPPGNVPAWENAARAGTIKTVAFDSLPETLPFIENGLIQATVAQPYWGWGYDTIGMLYDRVKSGKQFDSFTSSGSIEFVCSNNIAQYKAAWTSNDFSVRGDPCSL